MIPRGHAHFLILLTEFYHDQLVTFNKSNANPPYIKKKKQNSTEQNCLIDTKCGTNRSMHRSHSTCSVASPAGAYFQLLIRSFFLQKHLSRPPSGPILQQIAGISGSEDLREDQISSKSSAKLPAGTTHRTNTPFAQGLTHTLRGYIIALPDTPRGYTDVHNVAPHPQHDHRPVLFTDAGYCSHKNVFS